MLPQFTLMFDFKMGECCNSRLFNEYIMYREVGTELKVGMLEPGEYIN